MTVVYELAQMDIMPLVEYVKNSQVLAQNVTHGDVPIAQLMILFNRQCLINCYRGYDESNG